MDAYRMARRWIQGLSFIPATDFAATLKRRHRNGKKRK